ncbi:MAG TPA: adenosylcobinamide-phosphate synthase CbiB, partial [Candidatus Udaeobacter sp.]|nr:adenosylcobinamide-phosphate synthase CbiB [Candidatus Udaeobacter sp.]
LPHPVALIGRAIGWLDRRCNREQSGDGARRLAGILVVALLAGAAAALGLAIHVLLRGFAFGWIIEAALTSLFLAQHSLYRHVAEVARALASEGLAGGRRAVSRIVGRDPESLDQSGVCRAALESLAENFSDGVVAPLFWAVLAGLPGILVYKTVNTADSMIGHRTARHLAFGWAAARLDDVLNLVPARVAGLLLVSASRFLPATSPRKAFAAMIRDAGKHRSPNAGWQEAALAGALGVALAGPRRYGGKTVGDHWMNEGGRRDATVEDIRRGLKLFAVACVLQAGILAVFVAI